MDDNKYGFTDQMEGLGVPPMSNTEMSDADKRKQALSRRPGLRSLEEAKGQVSQEELLAGVDNAASFLVPFYDAGVNVSNVIEEYMKPEDERNYDYINEELGKAGTSAATEAAMMLAGFGAVKYGGKAYKALKNKVGEYEIVPETMSAFGVGAIRKKAPTDVAADKEKALAMLESKDLRNEWVQKKRQELGIADDDDAYSARDLVSKEEVKRRQTRKFPEQIKALEEDRMSGPAYRRYIRENQPATKFTKEDVETMLTSFEDMVGGLDALGQNKGSKGIIGLTDNVEVGSEVAARLDIPAYNKRDIWVAQITGGGKNMYGRTAVLKDVKFYIEGKDPARKSKKMRDVGKGEADKSPFATMKGEWQGLSDEEAFNRALSLMDDPDWIQVGFNPERHSFFYDKDTMMPVFEAEEVIQVGPLVLAKKAKLGNKRIDPETGKESSYVPAERIRKIRELKIEDKPGKPTIFNEGGVAMKEQMEMAFMNEGGVPDNTVGVDPVSGNDIPIGSTAEEVRDDIPAMLSEGEYVVPADVVKYHGLALFEALREQAKFGLREMAEDGRIGGEPIEGEMDEELTAEDQQLLQEIMAMEDDGVVKAAYGTFIPGNTSTTVPSTQVQMPTSGQTPASTQQAQLTTTQQDPSGVYGIVTGTGQPVTSSTPLVNQQPVVQGVVGTAPVVGDSTTTPGTTETGMVTKKYVAPDCRQIDVLTLNGKIISSTPADFDTFVEATEANLKRFKCITDDEVKVDETTTDDTTLTGGGDDDDLAPVIKTTGKKDNNLTAKQTLENEGINFDDPLAGAKAALEGGKDSKFFKGLGALGSLLLGPAAGLFAGALNVSSQVAKLNAAEMNYEYALMLGDIETANQIKALIDPFKKNMSGAASFVSEFGTSSDRFKNLVGAATEGGAAVEYLFNASKFKDEDSVRKAIDTFGTDFINFLGTESTVGTRDGGKDLTGGKQYIYNNVLTEDEKREVDIRDENIIMSQRARGDSGGSGSLVTGTATSQADLAAEAAKSSAFAKIMGQTPVSSSPSSTPSSPSTGASSSTIQAVKTSNAVNTSNETIRVGKTTSTGIDAGDGFEWEVKPGTNAKTRVWVGKSDNDKGSGSEPSSNNTGESSCCFIMLEARYGNGTMDEVVRRYRDEYMTDRNRRGYYKTAEVLVPLMRKSKVFKWVVTKTFADPLVSYGKYYYGENKHGVIFTPVKNFWMKLFDVVGGDTEFIRENGEVV